MNLKAMKRMEVDRLHYSRIHESDFEHTTKKKYIAFMNNIRKLWGWGVLPQNVNN